MKKLKEKVLPHPYVTNMGTGFRELMVLAQAIKSVVKQDLNPDLQASGPGLYHACLKNQHYLVPDGDVPSLRA